MIFNITYTYISQVTVKKTLKLIVKIKLNINNFDLLLSHLYLIYNNMLKRFI